MRVGEPVDAPASREEYAALLRSKFTSAIAAVALTGATCFVVTDADCCRSGSEARQVGNALGLALLEHAPPTLHEVCLVGTRAFAVAAQAAAAPLSVSAPLPGSTFARCVPALVTEFDSASVESEEDIVTPPRSTTPVRSVSPPCASTKKTPCGAKSSVPRSELAAPTGAICLKSASSLCTIGAEMTGSESAVQTDAIALRWVNVLCALCASADKIPVSKASPGMELEAPTSASHLKSPSPLSTPDEKEPSCSAEHRDFRSESSSSLQPAADKIWILKAKLCSSRLELETPMAPPPLVADKAPILRAQFCSSRRLSEELPVLDEIQMSMAPLCSRGLELEAGMAAAPRGLVPDKSLLSGTDYVVPCPEQFCGGITPSHFLQKLWELEEVDHFT